LEADDPALCSRSVSQDSRIRMRFHGRTSKPKLADVCGSFAADATTYCWLLKNRNLTLAKEIPRGGLFVADLAFRLAEKKLAVDVQPGQWIRREKSLAELAASVDPIEC
jgi:hypothetical protein